MVDPVDHIGQSPESSCFIIPSTILTARLFWYEDQDTACLEPFFGQPLEAAGQAGGHYRLSHPTLDGSH